MFKFLKKDQLDEIYSPVKKGKLISIENVPDEVFAQKLMGEGVGFINEENGIYAPCDGVVIMTIPTKHAIGLQSKTGVEVLIHIGLNTVDLNGKGFTSYVKKGDKVRKGDKLISFDKQYMIENNIDLTTPMVITNGSEYNIDFVDTVDEVNLQSKIMELKKRT